MHHKLHTSTYTHHALHVSSTLKVMITNHDVVLRELCTAVNRFTEHILGSHKRLLSPFLFFHKVQSSGHCQGALKDLEEQSSTSSDMVQQAVVLDVCCFDAIVQADRMYLPLLDLC